MRVVLIGADFEENLGLGMIAAVAAQAGHEVRIVPFNDPGGAADVVRTALAEGPDVVGLSMQFQHRAHEFLAIARRFRNEGYRGHVTAGGQFPTLAWQEVLGHGHGVDSVVLHEGEETFPALLAAIEDGTHLGDVPGLAYVTDDGVAAKSAARRLPDDLDRFPFPIRYRSHTEHFGVPFIPVMGGRGCWGKCTYCSITSFYRDARSHGGGKSFRLRSPENVAAEMALAWSKIGGPAIFCFHDDNFTLPRPSDTLERVRRIRASLDDYGVGDIGIVGKARPDTITPELARELRALGVIRLYVGVENASQEGGDHLRRGTQTGAVRAALKACREAGIFNCYNLLIFEPDARLDDVRENVEFIRDHASHPVNFCRAEPYFGTPLHLELERSQGLGGSYLGWNYRIEDDRTELLFRVCAAAFRERNFAPDGVANRYMGLGYAVKVLEQFYPDVGGRLGELKARATMLTRDIGLDTAEHLERALDFVEHTDPRDRENLERATARLGLEIAEADERWHLRLDRIYADMKAFSDGTDRRVVAAQPSQKLRSLASSIALGSAIAIGVSGCECGTVVDPVPQDAGMDALVADPPPPDAGVDSGFVVDPPPPDAGVDSGFVVDPPPPDAGVDAGMDAGFVVDPAPIDGGMSMSDEARPRRRLDLIDQWRDSSPRRAVRTEDLPLYDPPTVQLVASRDGDAIAVRIEGGPEAVGLRWEADGTIDGDGREVVWTPLGDDDRIRVAVRGRGGVAVVSLRARSARA